MYIAGAILLCGVIGGLGGYFIGWAGLFITIPIGFVLGIIAAKLQWHD